MTSQGWLDIHGHFYLPQTADEKRQLFQAMRNVNFLIDDGWNWDIDDTLRYLDMAGIQMQMLSYIPANVTRLKKANDFAASVVHKYPTRFGLLAAVPTDDAQAALAEVDRTDKHLRADGFAVSAIYNDVPLNDPLLEPVWERLNEMQATVFVHPNGYGPGTNSLPSPLIEVAFETTRVIVDMIYRRIFIRHPKIKFVIAHAGGALPMLAGRLELLGLESWVPNPEGLTEQELRLQLSGLYVDTAASAATGLQPAISMVGKNQVIYGADCGVPCSTVHTMEKNRNAVQTVSQSLGLNGDTVGLNGWSLFPKAAARCKSVQ